MPTVACSLCRVCKSTLTSWTQRRTCGRGCMITWATTGWKSSAASISPSAALLNVHLCNAQCHERWLASCGTEQRS